MEDISTLNNLLTALMTHFTEAPGGVHNDFYDYIGGRLFLDRAPEGAEFPYVVFSIVADTPDNTFTDALDDVLIQFSLYSTSSSATEMTTMYNDLKSLFDDCTFTLSPGTLLSMERVNLTTMVDDITTPSGTVGLKHWAVDYNVKVKDL